MISIEKYHSKNIFGAFSMLLGLMVVTPVLAQSSSSVQFYGIVDNGLGRVDTGESSKTLLIAGGQGASRWGFRGVEQLGAGFAATFNLEGQIASDEGTTGGPNGAFMRRSSVGLRGSWGELNIGRDYTPAYWALLENDIGRFGLFGTLQSINSTGVATPRASNGLFYSTPLYGGLQLRVMHAFGENSGSLQHSGDITGVGARYGFDKSFVNIAYLQLKSNVATAQSPEIRNKNQLTIGAGHNFQNFSLRAGGGFTDPSGARNRTAYAHVGGAYRIDAHQIYAQIIRLRNDMNGGRATTLGLSYTYDFSKRTNLYASWGVTKNNKNGNFPLNNSQNSYLPDAAGGDVKGVMLGVRHFF